MQLKVEYTEVYLVSLLALPVPLLPRISVVDGLEGLWQEHLAPLLAIPLNKQLQMHWERKMDGRLRSLS